MFGLPALAFTSTRARLIIILVTTLAYYNSFSVPFIFDDSSAIIENPTIRHLWPPQEIFSPLTNGTPVTGRPLLNASFALNWVLNGNSPLGFHLVNLFIHIAAALALFTVIQRTLALPALGQQLNCAATRIAAGTSTLWAVHPLTTESVTYISQRAETMMGLFYLLTLATFICGMNSTRRGFWLILSVITCLAGMATKEVMITAPLLVLLYDRTFIGGTFVNSLRQRKVYYIFLWATWIFLAAQMIHSSNRGNSIGFNNGISFQAGVETQFWAIARYLRLCLWPVPLTFDYGQTLVTESWQVIPAFLVVAIALVLTTCALVRNSPWGILGAWFFLILAPTSSIVPIMQQTIAEHRVYLSLASTLLGLHLILFYWLGLRSTFVISILVAFSCIVTIHRNQIFNDPQALWADSVSRFPNNARGWNNLGIALVQNGDLSGAIADFNFATTINHQMCEAYYNRGVVEEMQQEWTLAKSDYQAALKANPDFSRCQRKLEELCKSQPTSSQGYATPDNRK